jgi:hypothetical protein
MEVHQQCDLRPHTLSQRLRAVERYLKGESSMIRRVVSSMILILVLVTAAASAGTIRGVSGLIDIPNADALAPSSIETGVHVVDGKAALSITVGLAARLEAGLNTSLKDGSLDFTMKGIVIPETHDNLGMAVGYDTGSLYFVLSKAFNGLRGHIGFGDGRYGGVFAGLSASLSPVTVSAPGQMRPTTLFLLEHNGQSLSAGLRLGISRNLKADLAIVDLEKAMLGLSYSTHL